MAQQDATSCCIGKQNTVVLIKKNVGSLGVLHVWAKPQLGTCPTKVGWGSWGSWLSWLVQCGPNHRNSGWARCISGRPGAPVSRQPSEASHKHGTAGRVTSMALLLSGHNLMDDHVCTLKNGTHDVVPETLRKSVPVERPHVPWGIGSCSQQQPKESKKICTKHHLASKTHWRTCIPNMHTSQQCSELCQVTSQSWQHLWTRILPAMILGIRI